MQFYSELVAVSLLLAEEWEREKGELSDGDFSYDVYGLVKGEINYASYARFGLPGILVH